MFLSERRGKPTWRNSCPCNAWESIPLVVINFCYCIAREPPSTTRVDSAEPRKLGGIGQFEGHGGAPTPVLGGIKPRTMHWDMHFRMMYNQQKRRGTPQSIEAARNIQLSVQTRPNSQGSQSMVLRLPSGPRKIGQLASENNSRPGACRPQCCEYNQTSPYRT